MGKKIIMSVISDLVTDQRVHRSASALQSIGYEVLLVGRQKKDSLPMDQRPYEVKRFKLPFEKGFLFYAIYNIRLFIFLLLNKADVLHANDLDTLLPNVIIARWRKIPVIYDSHEYFTGVPELLKRPLVKKVWKGLEESLVPKVTCMFTVNESLSKKLGDEYHRKVYIMRNLPSANDEIAMENKPWPSEKKIILYQGAVNKDRGIEEAIEAMKYIPDAILWIIGDGDVLMKAKQLVADLDLNDKVHFKGLLKRKNLIGYTRMAFLGLCIEKPTNDNYIFALPNKLFDYIQAKVPILASKLIEIERIINEDNIGTFIESHDPQHIASKINQIIQDKSTYLTWKQNLHQIEGKYTWEKEKEELLRQYEKLT